MGALDGVRVLDVSRVLAGPLCGQMLAENGADVTKVEPPGGDLNRRFPIQVDGESTNFLSVNRGKRAITLNLQTERGRKLLHGLVRQSDVLIQNFLPDTASKLGTDYETIQAINPDLIHVTISGYGARGPLRNRPGYDMMVNAFCGIMSLTGEPDRPPVRSGVSALDMSTGMLAYAGTVTALLARRAGMARGQKVEVSLMETGLSLLGFHAVNWLVADHLDGRMGREGNALVPHAPYRCQDGDLMIGAGPDPAFRKLCGAIGAPQFLDDPHLATLAQRVVHADEVRAALESVLRHEPMQHWADLLDAVGVSCAPINTLDTVLSDPQVLANEMVVDAPKPDGSVMRLLGLPFKLSATPGHAGAAPPRVGADTDAILQRSAGISTAALRVLRDEKVI